MTDALRVFISGPYSAPTPEGVLKNTRKAMAMALTLLRQGMVPYCPHLSHFLEETAREQGRSVPYETWMAQDEEWLRVCDVLFLLGPSPGADKEVSLANELGIEVFTDLGELLAHAEDLRW